MKSSSLFRFGLQGRILSVFSVSVLATLIVALVGFFAIRALVASLEDLGHRRMVASREMLVASTRIGDLQTLLGQALSYTISAKERAQLDAEILAARTDYRAATERALPRLDGDERAKIERFSTEARDWAATNNQILERLKLLSDRIVDAPLTLQSRFEGFTADHLQLLATAQKHLHAGTAYEGGTDHTACRFGRWLSSYGTTNSNVSAMMQRAAEPHQKLHAAIHNLQRQLAAGDREAAAKLIVTEMRPTVEATVASLKELIAEPNAAIVTLDELNHLYREVSGPQSKKALGTIAEIVKELNDEADQAVKRGDDLANTAKNISLAVMILGTLAALVMGIYVARHIASELRTVAADLGGCSDQTAQVATQIATTSQNVAASASEQASSLEETSAALEELSGTTGQNAERARTANARAAAARTSAEHGNGQMQELKTAMESIQQSSNEITKIVKTIDEIAFQTNLLALNAAVEAARAGEAGAGFAIVADEVRSLAHRSAAAAKETTVLVENARNRSERGTTLAAEVSKDLDKILAETRTVDNFVGEISAASVEQKSGVDQIKQAASQLDTLVQGNAANAEENASAAEELQSQTKGMQGMVHSLLRIVNGASKTAEPSDSADAEPQASHQRPVRVSAAGTRPSPR